MVFLCDRERDIVPEEMYSSVSKYLLMLNVIKSVGDVFDGNVIDESDVEEETDFLCELFNEDQSAEHDTSLCEDDTENSFVNKKVPQVIDMKDSVNKRTTVSFLLPCVIFINFVGLILILCILISVADVFIVCWVS